MSNYPDGTWAGDPRAPWNAPDAEPIECYGCGKEAEDEQVGDICEDCGEDFREKEPDEPDWDSMPGGADYED